LAVQIILYPLLHALAHLETHHGHECKKRTPVDALVAQINGHFHLPACRGSCTGLPKCLSPFHRAPRNAQNRYKQGRSPIDALIAQVIGQLHLSPVREEGVQVLLKLLLSALHQWRPRAVR
jgi:hypothetical protein